MPDSVFVTGATGYIARHIVASLLNRGLRVTGSSRDAGRLTEMQSALSPALENPSALARFRLVELDLTRDDGWESALDGHGGLIHTASPFPIRQPRNAAELLQPAVEGTLRALNAARAAGADRVVLTSSTAAITDDSDRGHFSDTDWANAANPALSTYSRSKILAERAAWDYVAANDQLKLAVINPSLVLGAPLGHSSGTSISVISRIINGRQPMVPRLGFGTCDVRDVAEAHVAALERDAAIGGRHPIFDRFLWFSDMAGIVARTLPNARIASREAPDFFVRAMSIFDPSIRQILPFLGQRWEVSNNRMIEVLGVTPRDASAAVADTATYVEGLS